MTDSLPSDLEQDVNDFEALLEKIELQLEPFFKYSMKEHQDELSPVQSAKLNILVAYSLNSLFYSRFYRFSMYLQTQGVSPHSHPVKQELDRIKHYITKLQNIGNTQQQQQEKRMNLIIYLFKFHRLTSKLTIDPEASKRMINHTLNANQPTKMYNYYKN
ncbi:hypothetical protein PPL_00563 [Heterostelium album PN500]|uniref:Nuclear nucleic acid-binding protein C1D n=1 Tax=Heterostelium pallidum (strain ATCC 26659 / Pp 5 / PN500) TaxID=670386 RepID=D3AWT5_HETP5|nr:hypothetical protein PPL_00563 [Heterostelium album PN500]EFA86758.1 hypothetical protein PPL_00563 [Heterostelium album PN500]|eukprot:XP_020438862.1 hypothetical protein PPL_00563 [Heterostelium album PN500]